MSNPATIPAEGTILETSVAGTLTAVGSVEEIDGLEASVAPIKKTHLGSTAHENRPSRIPDPGKLGFKIQYNGNDSVHQQLYSRVATPGTVDNWKIIFNDGNTTPSNATFSGFVTKFKVSGIKVEENIMGELEVQLTTMPVFTAGTP